MLSQRYLQLLFLLLLSVSLGCASLPALFPDSGPAIPPVTERSTRANPLPREAQVALPNWEIRVTDVLRGDFAWQLLAEANRNNQPPARGWEYLLVRLDLRCTAVGTTTHTLALGVTGDAAVVHQGFAAVAPQPRISTYLQAGARSEGWHAFLVGVEERNLMLMARPLGTATLDAPRAYIALEPDARVLADLALADLPRNDLGMALSQPAPLGAAVITAEWELTVEQVLHGEAAWQRVLEANRYHKEPRDGMMYWLVFARVRHIGIREGPHFMSHSYFEMVVNDGEYLRSAVGVRLEPRLYGELFPDGELSGWLVFETPLDETHPILALREAAFRPSYARYLALTP